MQKRVPSHLMIEAFRASIMNGGIGAAADALGMSQSSVSRVVADLQKLVGFQLFVKQGRNVKPTEDALALMAKVQQSFLGLEDIARFSEQLRKQRMGRLSICSIPALGHSVLSDAVVFLREKHPDVVVSLDISASVDVVRAVLNRKADVGFSAHGLAVGEVEAVAEFTTQCVCIAPPTGAPGDVDFIELNQLASRPFVALTGRLQRRLEAMLHEAGLELNIVADVSQSLSASELVMRGAGISVIDPFTGDLHRRRGGTVIALRPSLPYNVQAVALGDTRLNSAARDLLQYMETAAQGIRDPYQQSINQPSLRDGC